MNIPKLVHKIPSNGPLKRAHLRRCPQSHDPHVFPYTLRSRLCGRLASGPFLEALKDQVRGFSLLEVMISLAILASSILILYISHSNSVLTSARSENVTLASLLAQEQLTQYLLDIEKDMALGIFPDEKEDGGQFDAPYERFKWEIQIKKVEIPLASASGDGKAQSNVSGSQVAQYASKLIGDGVRFVTIKISWPEGEEEEFITVSTHVTNMR